MMSKKSPQLRFEGFTDDWEQRKLGDFIDVKSGKDYKHLNSGPIPVYGTGGYMLSVDRALSDIDAIGIGRKGTIDKPYLLKAPFWTVDTLFYAVPKQNIDLQFSLSIFKKINWKKFDESTGVPSLSKTVINSVGAFVPSYEEQQKIGSFFKQLDETIALHQRKLDLLKEQKKGYLQKMFPKNGEKVPELRFAGFADDWEECKLGEVGNTFTGLSGKTKEDFGHGEGKFITYMNVFSNPVADLDGLESVEIDNKQFQVKAGDVLFTTSSETPEEVGMSSMWLGNADNIYLNSFCFGYRPTIEFDNYYLAFMFRSAPIRKKFQLLAQGISRYNISKNKVMEMSIPVPSIEEQEKIGSFFKHLDDTIALHQRKLDLLKEQKKGFLQKMFV
ncbi:restriction endonuclease subunit S [Streptococcus alactolyticus]|uniref:restriction endonuclease subunit S n=1 Tax=Streptococcus alactolyticus TaxID=29389 RepID=UPI003D0801F7